MRTRIIILNVLILFSFTACNSLSEKVNGEKIFHGETCNPYFNFDQIDHYSIEISKDKVYNPDSVDNSDEVQRARINVLTNISSPKSLSDSVSLKDLAKLGFKHSTIPENKFETISSIFCERKHETGQYSACSPVYRDILIFKKNSAIVGIAKICFTCDQHLIVGTDRNTEEFGQSGDYDRLKKILYP